MGKQALGSAVTTSIAWKRRHVKSKTRQPSEEALASLADRLGQVFYEPALAKSGKAAAGREQQSGRLPAKIASRLSELAALPDGWDGYGARRPTPWAVVTTAKTLDLVADTFHWVLDDLFLAPATDGGVRLEWIRNNGRELVVVLPPDRTGAVEFYRSDEARDIEEDVRESNLSRLPKLLNWLAAG